MIYQITMSAQNERKNVCIFAHPAWDYVTDARGNPTNDFLVIFVDEERGMRPRVFRRLPLDINHGPWTTVSPSKPHRVYEELKVNVDTRDDVGWELVTIEEIHDLRAYA